MNVGTRRAASSHQALHIPFDDASHRVPTIIKPTLMKRLSLLLPLMVILAVMGCKAQNPSEDMNTDNTPAKDAIVEFKTTEGDVTLRLYGDTPKHRANFLKLVKDGYYDGLLFHRVIKDFMVQTGDPDSRNAAKGTMLGTGDPGYTIDAEIIAPKYFNKRGALAAARTGDQVNPERRSSGSQFYIVTGRKFNEQQLRQMEHQLKQQGMQQIFDSLVKQHRDTIMSMRRAKDQAGLQKLQEQLIAETEAKGESTDFSLTPEQREAYMTVGGAPHLDGAYTVFGEVINGMDVINKIEGVATDGNDRPLEDVKILSAKVIEE